MLTVPGLRPPPPRGALTRTLGFARPYAVAAAGAAYLLTLGVTRRAHRGLLVELAGRFGHVHGAREPAELPSVPLDEAAPPAAPIDVRAAEAVDGNVTELELIAICRIVRATRPRVAFEFGTFDGRTTLNLAANAPDDARVHTLDLPRAALPDVAARLEDAERRYADKDVSGARFVGTPQASRIVQHFGDSATFDYTPLHGTVDLVFVDASHAFEYVVNDSLQALRLLAPGGGTVLWHDYGRWDGVTAALNQLRRADPRFAGLRHVAGTTLAMLTVAGERLT